MTRQNTDLIVAQINERVAFWTSKGFVGASVYEQLATDTTLPEAFPPQVIATVLNLQPPSLAKRRKRGVPPSFRRNGQNSVDYPRHSTFHYLRDCYVERRQPLASLGYTQTA